MGKLPLKIRIKNKLWGMLRDYFYAARVKESPFVLNLNRLCDAGQKKVLICYLPDGFFRNFDSGNIGRTFYDEIFKIINIFSELGYCIDLIGCNDIAALDYVRPSKYAVIFGFGETFYRMVQEQPGATSILYMTENHPLFSLQEETRRNDYFFERHKRQVAVRRSGQYYTQQHLEKKYSHILCLGNSAFIEDQYEHPHFINPTGIVNPGFVFEEKKHGSTRNHFLWLGSDGAVHKGLDLLIDVFSSRNDMVLHVCGLSDNDRKIIEIPGHENILDHGFIDVRSDKFLELVGKCSFIILPSCSEGFSTSITTGMLHGLIPVVMRNTGFDRLGEHAIFLEDFKIAYMERKLAELAETSPETLALFSSRVFDYARENFLLSVFEEKFRAVIREILEYET